MTLEQEVEMRIQKEFGDHVEIGFHDERGDGKHFFIEISSKKFEGKNRVERSQMVYAILDDLLKDDSIHALRMKLKIPA